MQGDRAGRDVVITEFITRSAMDDLAAELDVTHGPTRGFESHRVGERLGSALRRARALIVRSRTRVRNPSAAAAPALDERLGVGLAGGGLDEGAFAAALAGGRRARRRLDVAEKGTPGRAVVVRLTPRHNLFPTPPVAGLSDGSSERVATSLIAPVREVPAGA